MRFLKFIRPQNVQTLKVQSQATMLLFRSYGDQASLKEVLAEKIPEERERMLGMKCLYGDTKLADVTLSKVLGGMRSLPLLICDTSDVDPIKGLHYRGIPLNEVVKKLPRIGTNKEATPEAVFWLIASGDVPTPEQTMSITTEWHKRGKLPRYATKILDGIDMRVHPMAQLVAICACLSTESKFVKAYKKGVKKAKYWKYVYEDSMNLMAYIPTVAAIIYANAYKDGAGSRELNKNEDWSQNYCRMLGIKNNDFVELIRLYFLLHADHGSGNVSAHAAHLVASALSDPYLSYSAGMTGLAGPLHGLANQEVIVWLNALKKTVGEDPNDEDIISFVKSTIKSGRVIPGYGHAVLRKVDPRFTMQVEFAMKYCKDDKNVKLVHKLAKIVPDILSKMKKISSPYPNVDAHSGVLLQHYGIKELEYFTVLFGISRSIGLSAQVIWDRALGVPIERPKSLTNNSLCQQLTKKANEKKCKT